MPIKEELTSALKEAMKNKDVVQKNTVRMILSAIKNAEIDEHKELEEAEILGILQKQLKMRNDTLKDAQSINRQDIIAETQKEIEIIQNFLPEGMSSTELKEILAKIIEEVGAESMRDMGNVMKVAIPKLAGKAGNAEISQAVRDLLS